MEDEITKWKEAASVEEDVAMWKTSDEKFKNKFSTKSTWELLRTRGLSALGVRGGPKIKYLWGQKEFKVTLVGFKPGFWGFSH